MATVTVGAEAPDFTLPGDGGSTISLADFRGKIVVLFFYPKDNTEACTKEAIDFTALNPAFERIGAVLIGLSPDSVKRHDNFRKKHGLTVGLASDEEKAVVQDYGVWVEKSMYGRKYMGVERTTVLIDREGRIAHLWEKVKVPGHAEEVLATVRRVA